ncbi:MAG: uracil-DNA glycosylase [Methyloligella sp.]|nr:MAG: uracil-DNA glycosylase [Methyloligella sp.]
MTHQTIAEPKADCSLCPRLTSFRHENQNLYPHMFNGAVPSFGTENASLLIVGLAPGLKGANQTGRPFTGDYAGDLLYATLLKYGFASGKYLANPDDGLKLKKAMITNAVRCVPPQNKPIGEEIKTCRTFLRNRIDQLPKLKLMIVLGRIAHESVVATVGGKQKDFKFSHGGLHDLPTGHKMLDSYHCSRYNTNTGRLTTEMFEDVFDTAKKLLSS